MDHELRLGVAPDSSIKDLSAASAEGNGGDEAVLANLLRSMDAQGDGGSGPVATILHGAGILRERP